MSKRLKNPKHQSKRRDCLEFTSAPVSKVNREKGVIEGVKLSGLESRNGRRYLTSAFQRALPLYEGKTAYLNHPIDPASGKPKPGRVRVCEEALGVWRNVRMQADGPYGDLHFLKSHPMAERICEVAERMPNLFGCSHNAVGDGEYKSGVFEISTIPEVRSVDIVCDPGTTNGLFESGPNMTTWKNVLESIGNSLHESKRKRLQKLMEDEIMPPDMPMAEPASEPSSDPDQALADGFRAAIIGILDSDATTDEKIGKIKELLKTQDKLTSTPAAEPAPEMEDEETSGEKPEQTVARLKAELAARSICEANEFKASESMLKVLARMESDDERKAFVLEMKARGNVKEPRSSAPGNKQNVTEQKQQPTDVKSFMSAIKG